MADETLTHGSKVVINADEAVVLETVYGCQPQLGDVISLEVISKGTQLATVTGRMWSDTPPTEGKTLQVTLRVI